MDDNRMRNLSVKQTLDELLGISREPNNKPSTSGTSGLINGLFDSSMRPPTRHGGRDSVSSNEENRDPSTSLSASYQRDKEKQERPLRRDKSLNDSDDDFIRRLSEMRKQTSLGSGRSMTGGTSVIRTEKRQSNTSTIEETEEHLPLPFDNPSELSPSPESKNETYRIKSSESETKTEPKPSKTEEAPKPKERQKPAPVPAVRRKSVPKKTEKPAVARIERTEIPSEDNATFKVWQQKVDEKEREQRKLEKEENDRKKKDQQEKKLLAQKQFERWKEDRDAIDKERRLKEKQKKMKEAERIRAEKESKKKDAEKAFESWKKERSKSMHQIQTSKKLEEEKKKHEEEERKKQQRKEAQAAFQAWLNKKKDEEKEAIQQLQQHLKNKLDEEEINDYKRLLADEAYQTWLQLKEADALRQETASEHQTQLTPWIPPNNTVPRQFVPTGLPRTFIMKELNRVLLYLLAVSCSFVHAGQAYYKIQGHYAGVTAASIYGKEKIRSAFLPEEQKIASELAGILGNDYSEFYVQYFEIHGEDAGFPTTIYFGYLSTNDQNNRDDLISKIQADKDMMLYFMMSVDTVPPVPSLLVEAPVDSCKNGGILLPNRTCACPPYTAGGDQCDQVVCRHYGIQDQSRCACPPGSYAFNCEPRSCMTPVTANLDTSFQSLIFVISLKSSMAYDLYMLMGSIPTLVFDYDNFAPDLVKNFIVTTFLQNGPTYYMSTAYFDNQNDLMNYLKGQVHTSTGDQDQPVLSAIVASQAYAPLMRPRSNVLVFHDGAVNETFTNETYISTKYNETVVIAQTLQWKNRITFLLTQTADHPMDTFGDYFNVYRRVARAVHGDVLIMNKQDLNNTLFSMICYYYQIENVHALYGVNSSQVGLALDSDYGTETVYVVISVEINQTLPTIKTATGASMLPQFNTSLFAVYRTSYSQTTSVTLTPNPDPYNVRVFINSANSAWIAYHDDSAVDVGDTYALAGINQYATGYSNWPGVSKIQFYIAPSNDDKTPLGKTYQGSLRDGGPCTFPWGYGQIDNCTPGPYSQIVKLYDANNTEYFRILPGFCFSPDQHSKEPWRCLNGGTPTGTVGSCQCNATWTGAHCQTPVCQNGGRPDEFPGNGRPICLCQFGFSGDFCQLLNCTTPAPDIFQSYSRTFALVVENTLFNSQNGESISKGLQSLYNVYLNNDTFADYVLTTFKVIDDPTSPGNYTPQIISNKFSDPDAFLNATATANIQYGYSPLGQQPSLFALDIAMRSIDYDKSAIILFTTAPPTSLEDDPNYLDVVLQAVERQLEINIVIAPPFGMRDQCTSPGSFDVLADLVRQTGGNILNLCNSYNPATYNNNDLIIQFLNGYGNTHHHIENIAYGFSGTCSSTVQFTIEDTKNLLSESYIFVNSPSVETFKVTVTNLDDGSALSTTNMTNLPYMAIYKIETSSTAPYAKGFSANVQAGGGSGNCSVRVGLRSQLGVYVGFSPDPSRDKLISTMIYGTTINPVVHVSSALQSSAQVMAIATDDAGTEIYNYTAVARSPTCHYEKYFMTPMTCSKPYTSETVTVKIVTSELTVQRSVRGFCSFDQTRCHNGGTYNTNTQSCDCTDGYSGAVCENPACLNGGTVAYFRCYCTDMFAGQRCEYARCHDYNWLESQDVRATNFQQITFVIEMTQNMVEALQYLRLYLIPQVLDQTDDINNPKQYSIVTFDENGAQVLVSTTHKDILMTYANKYLNVAPTNNPTTTRVYVGVKAALDITIQYPHQVNLFTTTAQPPASDYRLGVRQNFGAQINTYYISTNADPIPDSRYELQLISRQTGGRIWPIKYNRLDSIANATSQSDFENGLVYDDGWKDCTTAQNGYFTVESTAKRLVISVTGQGVNNAAMVSVYKPGDTSVTITGTSQMYGYETLRVISLDLTSISGVGGQWRVNVKSTSGSCFVQARVISDLHIIPGFTTDMFMDWVSPSPFFGLGKNDSAYLTMRVTNSTGRNYGITINSVDILKTDPSQPWQDNSTFGTFKFNPRDPFECANQWVSEVIMLNSFKYWKWVVRGKDATGSDFQRSFFIVRADVAEIPTRCVNGQPNDYGECVCSNQTAYFGADCSMRWCQNGGVSSMGICDCPNGYYGPFCENFIASATSTSAAPSPTSPSPGASTQSPPATQATQATQNTQNTPPVGTTASNQPPATTPTTPPGGSTVSPNCAPQFTTYYLFHFLDGSGTSDVTFTSTQELVTIMSSQDNLDLDNSGTRQNTRYMLGLMGTDFIGYPNNITGVQQISTAFNSLNSRISGTPGFINYTASLTNMATNNVYKKFDPSKEAPPVAILYPGVQNVYGVQNIKDGVTALTNLGFRVLAVNMNAGLNGLTDDLNNALGPDNVYTYASTATDAVGFIMRRLCMIKPTLS